MFQQLKQRFLSQTGEDDTKLNTKEIDLIRETWSHLRSDIAGFKTFGADLFIVFFQHYPDYQKQFKSFKDVPISFSTVSMQTMRYNKKLLAHGTYVMYTLSMIVDNLTNPETLDQMLKRFARNHYRRRIQITAFERLRDIFIVQLAERLGPELFGKKATIAWRKVFDYILNALDREFNMLEIDVQKRSSYYQLNAKHRSVRNNMLKQRLNSITQNDQLSIEFNLNRLGVLNQPIRSSGNVSMTSSTSNLSTDKNGKETKQKTNRFTKKSFAFIFKPFKLVKKSIQLSN
ncbi:oxygen carrier [Blomia tropicalis]|nr:oxygen carrier [Blomia tropicalis]